VAVKKAKVALSAALKAASPKATPKAAKVAEEAAVEAAAAATEVVEASQNVEEVKALSPLKTTKKKRRTEVERLQDGGSSGAAGLLKTVRKLTPLGQMFVKNPANTFGTVAGTAATLAGVAHNRFEAQANFNRQRDDINSSINDYNAEIRDINKWHEGNTMLKVQSENAAKAAKPKSKGWF
jgi:hypothetical protein